MLKLPVLCILFTIGCTSWTVAQMQNIYKDVDAQNEIKSIHFLNANEGFVAFEKWVGFTKDGGKTFLRKYVTYSNVNYGTYYVNLTFGFDINGVYAFSKDSLLLYGHYGFVPAILLSTDQGNTFKLIYYATSNLTIDNNGIQHIVFPKGGQIGFAVEKDNVLKTVNKGQSWSTVLHEANGKLFDIDFVNSTIGYVASENKVLKTTNSGSSFEVINIPIGTMNGMDFLTESLGWITIDNNIYKTDNGGLTWQAINSDLEKVGKPIYFVNDTTGFYVGGYYTVFKTSDAGKHWEPLQRQVSGFTGGLHMKMFHLSNSIFWAGGTSGVLDITLNSGGLTLPVAYCKADLSDLSNTGKIYLKNHSKPGNSYKWVVNSSTISTEFDTEYISDRQTIDTIFLIVTKSNFSDTSEKIIIDTRINNQRCFASFTQNIDTGTVSLFAGYHTTGVKHFWDFGDGVIDSININPVHHYKSIGTYTVSHKVFNTIDKCSDSATTKIIIYRTQNCLDVDFTYTADSFYTNRITFKVSYDQTKEHDRNPWTAGIIGADWGDGSQEVSSTHTFDSAKYYNVCLYIKHYYTGCVTKVCKPVLVEIERECNADFKHELYYGGDLHAEGKPHATQRQHMWIINGQEASKPTTSTEFNKNFASSDEWNMYLPGTGGCSPQKIGYSIDSINKKLTHIVYDIGSKCSDTVSRNIQILRRDDVFIKAVPHPAFSQYYSFYAYTLSLDGDTIPYQSPGWRIQYPSGTFYTGGGNGSSKLTYTFEYPTRARVAIPSERCYSYQAREIYYIDLDVTADPCPIFPPDFNSSPYGDNPLTIKFQDITFAINSAARNKVLWLFGDGDSSKTEWVTKHTFPKFGTYNVTMRYTSPTNCVKEITKEIMVEPPCSILPKIGIQRDSISGAKISFLNLSQPNTSTAQYIWHFGTGDSSTIGNPIYQYTQAGSYQVKLTSIENEYCTRSVDTMLTITPEDICNVTPKYEAKLQDDNIVYVINNTTPRGNQYQFIWTFGDGSSDSSIAPTHTYFQSGNYQICLKVIKDWYCQPQTCDSILVVLPQRRSMDVFPNPTTSELYIRYINPGTTGKVNISIINSFGRTVKQREFRSTTGQNRHVIEVGDLQKGNYFIHVVGLEKVISGRVFLL